jgi:DNA-3-methyladenine glycosylase I
MRCPWPNLEKSQNYMEYHDNEWGVPSYGDRYLFEMFLLESFHCGLSWLIILNKRESFRDAFDGFDPTIVKDYDEDKVAELLNNKEIVRNEAKIRASINNALCFIKVQKEFGSFCDYIWSFTNNEVVYIKDDVLVAKNALSDLVAKDLKKRGFKFMGSVTAYSYLEAIGVMNNHCSYCIKGHKKD